MSEEPFAQARDLILTLRPSIAWRLGLADAPLDLLTDRGILGWKLGVSHLVEQLAETPDPTARQIERWLTHDVLLEGFRWRSLHTVLARGCLALGPAGESRNGSLHDLVIDAWIPNITAAFERVGPSYSASNAEVRLAKRLERFLPLSSETAHIRKQLLSLVPSGAPEGWHRPDESLWNFTGPADRYAIRRAFEVSLHP